MDPNTAENLAFVLEAPMGFYKRADMLVRLLTAENVSEVMSRLPAPFREEIIEHAREVYLPEGEPFVIAGAPLPGASIAALRGWLASRAQRSSAFAAAFAALSRRVEIVHPNAIPLAPPDLVLEEAGMDLGMPRRAACI